MKCVIVYHYVLAMTCICVPFTHKPKLMCQEREQSSPIHRATLMHHPFYFTKLTSRCNHHHQLPMVLSLQATLSIGTFSCTETTPSQPLFSFLFRGIYARNHNVIDLAPDAHKLTHLLYAFANLEPSGNVILGVCIGE